MLSNAIDDYLAIRRAAGFQLRVAEYRLRSFTRFATERGESHVLRQTAIQWAALAPSPASREKRLSTLRVFVRHARAEDERHEPLPQQVFAKSEPPRRPHLLAPADITRVLAEASQLAPTGSLRPQTYYTLFGLLVATGLRVGEALALRLGDVIEDGLIIRETKFRKSRMVPLHDTTQAAVDRYIARRRHLGGADDHVFISLRGHGLRYNDVNRTFLTIVRKLGLHPGAGKPGPRIHHMRHGFAVGVLETCPQDRLQVSRHMLALSTYMGHARIADTCWYLQATPRLMADIADVCEIFLEGGTP